MGYKKEEWQYIIRNTHITAMTLKRFNDQSITSHHFILKPVHPTYINKFKSGLSFTLINAVISLHLSCK